MYQLNGYSIGRIWLDLFEIGERSMLSIMISHLPRLKSE
jgi:hypothetical protein